VLVVGSERSGGRRYVNRDDMSLRVLWDHVGAQLGMYNLTLRGVVQVGYGWLSVTNSVY